MYDSINNNSQVLKDASAF